MPAKPPPSSIAPAADYSLGELAAAVNAWCTSAGLSPANGQVGETLTERNLRFYRTVGILDAPVSGGGRGYTEKHLLQLTGIRLLQAQGLPLRRIRELLFGRTLAELRELRDRGRTEARASRPSVTAQPAWVPGEPWQFLPLSPDLALLHKTQLVISPEQLRQINAILGISHKP